MRLTLAPHPDTPCDAVREIAVEVVRKGRVLSLTYTVEGDLSAILMPNWQNPARADDLWKHTCFEAFIAPSETVRMPADTGAPLPEGGGRGRVYAANSTNPLPPTASLRVPPSPSGRGTGELGAYSEFNLSPSGQWAAYVFDGYRAGMADRVESEPKTFEDHRSEDRYGLTATFDLPDLAAANWRLGLSAVIERTDGSKSYWALAHAPGKPDFHHPDAFAAILPPESP